MFARCLRFEKPLLVLALDWLIGCQQVYRPVRMALAVASVPSRRHRAVSVPWCSPNCLRCGLSRGNRRLRVRFVIHPPQTLRVRLGIGDLRTIQSGDMPLHPVARGAQQYPIFDMVAPASFLRSDVGQVHELHLELPTALNAGHQSILIVRQGLCDFPHLMV